MSDTLKVEVSLPITPELVSAIANAVNQESMKTLRAPLTVNEFCEKIGNKKSSRTVRREIEAGTIKSIEGSYVVLIPFSEVERYCHA